MKEQHIQTINYPRSVVEVYMIGKDKVKEVKCLHGSHCKEYHYTVEEYLASSLVPNERKSKVESKLSQ